MAEGKIMNKDVNKNDKNRRNALGGTYAVIQKEKKDYSKIWGIRQYMQAGGRKRRGREMNAGIYVWASRHDNVEDGDK